LWVAARADVNAAEKDGWTALHWAAMEGHTDVVRLLLQNGANVEAVTERGLTPLRSATSPHNAAQSGVRQ